MDKIMILLPKQIYILRDLENQKIRRTTAGKAVYLSNDSCLFSGDRLPQDIIFGKYVHGCSHRAQLKLGTPL